MGIVFSFDDFNNNFSNIFQTLFTWIGYNRDMYADNLALRQEQLYQKRDYHLEWIDIAREDIKETLRTSVEKVSSYMIVSTLIFDICGAAVVELDPNECTYLHKVLIYMCLSVSMMYLMMSILFAIICLNTAFKNTVDILANAIRPDPTDAYDKSFDYMKQTQQFEKTITQVLRIPILKPMYKNYVKGRTPRFEHFNIGHLGRELQGSTSSLTSKSHGSMRQPFHAGPVPSDDKIPLEKEQSGTNKAQEKSNINAMFDQFSKAAWLWNAFERASMGGLSYGSLYLGYTLAYASLGMLDGKEGWKGKILAWLILFLMAGMFTATYPGVFDKRGKFKLFGNELEIKVVNRCGKNFLRVTMLLSFFPLLAILVVEALQKSDLAELPAEKGKLRATICFIHTLAALLHVAAEATTDLEFSGHLEEILNSPDEVEPQHDSGGGLLTSASSPTRVGKAADPHELDYEAHQDDSFSVDGDPLAEDVDQESGGLVGRTIQKKTAQKIKATFKAVKKSVVIIHSIVVLGWICFALESFLSVQRKEGGHRREDHGRRLRAQIVPTSASHILEMQKDSTSRCNAGEACANQPEWPNYFFQPRAMACAQGSVFVADEFRVYQLASGKLSPVNCTLRGAITDIAAACDASSCWPLVLTGHDQAELVNCQTGEAFSFAQTARVERIACRNGSLVSSLYALRGGQLVEYRLGQRQHVLEPWWPVADVDAAGLRAVEVVDGRIFFFRNLISQGVTSVRLESHMLKRNSPAENMWTLPEQSPPLIGGCVLEGNSSSLVLLQSQDGDYSPRLVKVNLS